MDIDLREQRVPPAASVSHEGVPECSSSCHTCRKKQKQASGPRITMRPGWVHLVSLMIQHPSWVPLQDPPSTGRANGLEQCFRTRLPGLSSEREPSWGRVSQSPSPHKTSSAPSLNLVHPPPHSALPKGNCPTSSHPLSPALMLSLTSPLFLATS